MSSRAMTKLRESLKILVAARDAGFIGDLISFIEGDKTVEFIWNASNVIEDNELLSDYMPSIEQALGKSESNIRAFLETYCIAD